jgi:hypothetical protein
MLQNSPENTSGIPEQRSENTAPTEEHQHIQLPNRRSFMRQVLGHSAVAAEVAYMATPLVYLLNASTGAQETDSVTENRSEASSYQYTDTLHTAPDAVAFRNIGVIHTEEQYAQDKEHLLSAISEADVVLVERGGYFERLAMEARRQGKVSRCIDYYNLYKLERSLERSPFLAAAAGGWLGVDYAISKFSESNEITPKLRRAFARVLGYMHANTAFPSPQFVAHWNLSPESYPAGDLSFFADGRTVKMLEHIERIASENADKKLLVITGSIHAAGFDYYLQNSATRKLFEVKKALYNILYEDYHHSAGG